MSAFSQRQEIESLIRSLRLHKQVDSGDRREIEGMIEQAERELREIDKCSQTKHLSSAGGGGYG